MNVLDKWRKAGFGLEIRLGKLFLACWVLFALVLAIFTLFGCAEPKECSLVKQHPELRPYHITCQGREY